MTCFSKFSRYFLTASVRTNAIFSVGPLNKIGHPTRSHRRYKRILVVSECQRNVHGEEGWGEDWQIHILVSLYSCRCQNVCHCALVHRQIIGF